MTTSELQRVNEIFNDALEVPRQQREKFVQSACNGDRALVAKVERLLELEQHVDQFLEEPVQREIPEPPRPESIGEYRVCRTIARGGMGIVYEAEQEHPHRTVALKILRSGIASPSAMRRFEFESQILARLQHPNIANVYEAGTHDDGSGAVPYFAMEYVAGAKTITEHAMDNTLAIRERLEIFTKVCDAVHYGHQKGIIHRDLKPANLLIDESGEPKIIDFGVARATDSDLAITTRETNVGQLIGTLQYMSPEQCAADPHDVDIRSDVYALGVVLFELLSDGLPYDLRETPIHEAVRVIRDEDPISLSTVSRTLRGDLDTIVGRALAKDRTERYASAAELGADIRRHLNDEPVLASPPSAVYRFRKFARRHRGMLTAGVGMIAVLLVGTVLSIAGFVTARTALTSEQVVTEFLTEILASADPSLRSSERGKDLLVATVLDNASRRVEERFPDQPLIEATVRHTIGNAYLGLGLWSDAEPHLERALEIRRQELGADDAQTLEAMHDLAQLYRFQDRPDEAKLVLLEALAGRRRILGDGHELTVRSMSDLGRTHWMLGEYEQAETILLEAIEVGERALEDDHPDTASAMSNLAVVHLAMGRYPESERLNRSALASRTEVLGRDHWETTQSMASLGILLMQMERFDEAEQLLTEVGEIRARTLGDEHPGTLSAQHSLGNVYRRLGRYEACETLTLRVLEARRRVIGPKHRGTAATMRSLGNLYKYMFRYDEAESYLLGAIDIYTETRDADYTLTLWVKEDLAFLYNRAGRFDEAERIARELVAVRRDMRGDTDKATVFSMYLLATVLVQQGQYEEAERLMQETLDIRRENLQDEKDVRILKSMGDLGWVYIHQGRYAEAERITLEVLALRRETLGDTSPDTRYSMSDLAWICDLQGRLSEAARRYEEVLAMRRELLDGDPDGGLGLKSGLTRVYTLLGRHSEADALRTEVLEVRRRRQGDDSCWTLLSEREQAWGWLRQGRLDDAEAQLERVIAGQLAFVGEHHPWTLDSLTTLARVHRRRGDDEFAARMLERVHVGREVVLGRQHPDTVVVASRLAATWWALDRRAEAEDLFVTALERAYELATTQGAALTARRVAWEVACQSGLPSTIYESALDVAEGAVSLVPDDWDSLTALAACRMRTRQHAAAVESLDSAESLLRAEDLAPSVGHLALRAMVTARLGDHAAARQLLAFIDRGDGSNSPTAGDDLLYREATAMITAPAEVGLGATWPLMRHGMHRVHVPVPDRSPVTTTCPDTDSDSVRGMDPTVDDDEQNLR